MPNWCENTLTIAGPPDKVNALMRAVEAAEDDDSAELKVPFSFNKVIPMPEELRGTTAGYPRDPNAAELKAKYGYENWYEWAVAHWDTKWDLGTSTTVEERLDGVIKVVAYHFDSAWGPPIKVIQALAEQHPDVVVHLRFEEPGMDFAGCRVYKGEEELETVDLGAAPSRIDFDEWRYDEHLQLEG